MKPLFPIVVAILVITANAHPKNIEDVKELPQNKEPLLEAEESDPQARIERCTTCSGSVKLTKSPKDVLAALQQLPGGEVHTQQSFEGCSSDKGCAGLKVKDGRVVERFGNTDAFQAAAQQNNGNEFTFHAAGSLGNLLEGGLNGEGSPFWWMNQQNSPFKNAANAGGNFGKYSKSSSSSFSTTGNAGAAGLDLGANPFLNGDFSKLSGGFTSGGAGFTSAGAANAQESKPGYQSASSFESSSFSSSSKGETDLANNPFLNGAINKFGQSGFQAQGNFNAGAGQSQFGAGQGQASGFGAQNSQSGFNQASYGSSNKFGASGAGYTGSSPSPFTASTGSNVNLIQNTQKASEFDFQQQQQTQQNIDDAFRHTGNVNAHEHSGGDLQQTCAGQGYVCVHKAQCNNGVVNTNGGSLLQASTQKQYCNVRTEICCRIETSSLAGAGSLQGSLGVGSATFSGSSNQGAGLFATSNQNSAGQSGSFNGQASGLNGQASGFNGQASGFNGQAAGTYNQNSGSSFNQNTGTTTGFGSSFNKASSSGYGSQGSFGSGVNSFGSDAGSVNRGVSVESSSSSFDATRGNKFGGYGGSTIAPSTNKFGANNFNNEVFKSTSQSNFIETDSFSSGSEQAGVYRPGASGSGLKPGIPYLPPVDSSTSASNTISSTAAFVTTPRPRPTTVRPFTTSRPFVPSTSAPGYLPPQGESTINRETRLPPNPVYNEGNLILDETRQTTRPPIRFTPGPAINDIPAGCAAALKCTPIEFCTAEGVISTTTVVLTRDQDAYRVPLTDCRDIESGRVGKCCRDPLYTDPWPTNQLGKWVSGVFGGNDGKYVPDSKGSPSTNVQRPQVTARPPTPPVTGSVVLNNFRTTKPTVSPYGPNQITPGYPSSTPGSFIQKGQGQYETKGQGSYGNRGQGQIGIGGQGQFGAAGVGQTSQGAQFGQGSQFTQTTSSSFGQSTRGQGQGVNQGFGQGVIQGVGQGVTQGQGSYSKGGQGQYEVQGQAGQNQYTQTQGFSQGQGQSVSQGQGFGGIRGSGQSVSQGVGQSVSQGFGQTVTQGQGFGVIRGSGQSVTNGQSFTAQQGQGQGVSQGQGQTVSQGAGFGVTQGQGLAVNRGQGTLVSRGQGQIVSSGQGVGVSQGSGQTVNQGFGVSQGFGSGVNRGQGQFTTQGQGQSVSQGSGFGVGQDVGFGVTQGQGQTVTQGSGFGTSQGFGQSVSQGSGFGVSQGSGQAVSQGSRFGVSQGSGQAVSQGSGFGVSQGSGFGVSQGSGFGVSQGSGQAVSQGGGFGVSQGQGQSVSQGSGFGIQGQGFGSRVESGLGFGLNQGLGFGVIRGQGQTLVQGQGQKLTQGVGSGEIRGEGFQVTQGGGIGVENEYSESVQRVFLSQYSSGGQCGRLNPQKPYGNKNDLEADFGQIPWQAMVLLQTNRSLLCGGVITRPDVVVTSAACVEGLDAKNVLIKAGEWKLGVDEEPLPFQIVQVKTILRHPFYQPANLKYDAAILVLSENLRFAKNIYPICLPGAKETLDAFYNGAGECIVTGWGKIVLQAHLEGSIMHSLNVSLINPGECEAKLQSDYPHLLEQYDEDSCVCGQPTNPSNNICKVDIGSALACTTGDGHYVFRGVYSWDSGCQLGNQIAGFWKFDLEWYEWAIGLIESVRFSKYSSGSKITKNKFSGQINNSGIKTNQIGIKGSVSGVKEVSGAKELNTFAQGLGQFGFGSSKFTESSSGSNSGFNAASQIKGPISNTFSATYTEKKVFQSEPKFVTYTTKPEIVTFTTKPEYFTYTTKPKFVTYTTKPEIVTYTTKPEIVTYTTKPEIVTYTTKPKIVTYTTKPQIIRYETSGSGTNPQYVAPGVTFNPSFSEVVGHKHSGACKCLEGKK